MRGQVIILELPHGLSDELQRDFRHAAPDDWRVEALPCSGQPLEELLDQDEDQLLVVPEDTGDGPESGLQLVRRLRQLAPRAAIVVLAERGTVGLAARSIDAGATDFLVRGDHLRARIATLFGKLRALFEASQRNRMLWQRNTQLQQSLQARHKIVGESPQVRELRGTIERVAEIPRPLLIMGERGTGKELVARAVHGSSGDAARPLVTLNCAAFNDALLESELFGHERGAFTGADAARRGKFELADGGTLFLDEIGNMSLAFQEKILRVVEYGTFTRIGGTTERTTTVRIIAATNRELPKMIRQGEFLHDLYDRLTFETITVPPLREREGDVAVLAHHFLQQFALEIPAFRNKTLSQEALAVLRVYRFPGNVRELKNIIERAAYRDTTDEITPSDIGMLPTSAPPEPRNGSFTEQVENFSRSLLIEAIKQAAGNQAAAARLLGLTYDQFRHYHRKYVKLDQS